jgi:hypothetical protein
VWIQIDGIEKTPKQAAMAATDHAAAPLVDASLFRNNRW